VVTNGTDEWEYAADGGPSEDARIRALGNAPVTEQCTGWDRRVCPNYDGLGDGSETLENWAFVRIIPVAPQALVSWQVRAYGLGGPCCAKGARYSGLATFPRTKGS